MQVSIYGFGKPRHIRVHRLVALTFIGSVPPGHEVHHVDGDKTHNAATNLQYVTPRENMRAALPLTGRPAHRLTSDDIDAIRASSATYRELASRYGVTEGTIYYHKHG